MIMIAVSGCGGSATPTEAPPPPTTAPEQLPEEPETPEEPAHGAFPDLGGVEVTVAVENAYPPFNSIDEASGEPVGWDYDAAREICNRINCVPLFVEAAWDGIFPAMEAGEYDWLADGVTITEERAKIVDFSVPYVTIGQTLLVRVDETASVDDFVADDNMLIGTQIGTTNEIVAQEYFPVERIKSFEDFPATILALLANDIDGVVIDNVSALGFMEANEGKLKIIGQLTSDEQLGFVFPPGSELRDAVDAALLAMEADGTLEELNLTWGLITKEAPAAELPDLGGMEVTVAVENAYPPFNSIDEASGEPVGWDYDAAREICDRINCVPVFVEAAWDGIFPAMEAGEYDWLADGVTITEERAKIVDFSVPYVTIGQTLLVRVDETASVDDFVADDNMLIGTQIGTTNEIVAQEYFPVERIKSFEDFPATILALLANDIDGVVIDNVSALGFMEANEGKLKIIGQLTSDEQLGFVFPPGSELRDAVDAALLAMEADGTLEELNLTWGLITKEAPAAELPDLGGMEVTVAVENAYPPFNSIDEASGEPVGWDYDAAREICNRINCVPLFVEAAWDGIFPAMEAGEYDWLADGVTITEERAKIVDFSVPYVTIGQTLLVRTDETATVDDFVADDNMLIGTQIGTTNEIVAQEYFPVERIKSFEDFPATILALLANDIDGVVIDNVSALGFMEANEGKLKIIGQLTSDEQLGFVFPPGSELRDAVDAALLSMKADGKLEELNLMWGLVQ